MTEGPSTPISKARSPASKKKTKRRLPIETPAKKSLKLPMSSISRASAPSLDIDDIDLTSLTSSQRSVLLTVGQLKRFIDDYLETKEKGQVNVKIACTVIRMPSEWSRFRFFSIIDHTGYLTIGAKVPTFKVLEDFHENPTNPMPVIEISGDVVFKWSTNIEDEIYITLQDKAHVVTVDYANHPAACGSCKSLQHVFSDSLFAKCYAPRLLGNCIKVQHDGKSRTFLLLKDNTGWSVVHVLNCSEYTYTMEKCKGVVVVEGNLGFEVTTLNETKAIMATIDNDSVLIKQVDDSIMEGQKAAIERSDEHEYLFDLD